MPVIAPWPEQVDEQPGDEQPGVDVGAESDAGLVDVPQMLEVPDKPGTAVVLARRPSIGLIRPGPGVIADDSWNDPPLPVLARAIGRARRVGLRSPVLVAVIAVLIGLGVVVAVPFAFRSQPDAAPEAASGQLPTGLDEPQPEVLPGSTDAQSSAPLSTGESATPASTTRPTQAQPANPTTENGQSSAQQGESAPNAPFETLTIEAEGGALTGAARVLTSYPNTSGGKIVYNIGAWDDDDPPGTLTLTGIVFPQQANYTITVHYVHLFPQANAGALVSVTGASGVWVDFAWNWSCCRTVAATINIAAGTRSITFANSTGRVAWIDKVVITQA